MSLTIQGNVDRSGIDAVERLLAEGTCRSAIYQAETTSTNSDAIAEIRDSVIDASQRPRLYLTDQQTAGRGRHGRTWISQSDSLAFSLIVTQPSSHSGSPSSLTSIAVGVAIARAIEFSFAPLKVRLKWPNDVYLSGGKVAGILLESTQSSSDQVVIGVGININDAPARLPGEQAAMPTSIASAIGRSLSRYDVLESVVQQIAATIDELNESSAEILQDFRARCLLSGQQVQFQQAAVDQTGICHGITDGGELAIETSEGKRHCKTGEVRLVRPMRP